MAARVIDSITGSQEGRAVAAYLRGPISGGSPWRFNLSNEADVRGGIIHYPLLGNLPSPSDPSASSFGVQQSGAFTAEIVPPARGAQAVQIGAGAYINTPDSAATSPTGSFEIRFKCRAASYANGSFQTIAGKYTEGGAKSWVIYWTAAGTFAVSWSNDGSTIAGAQAMGGVPPSNLPVVIRVLADASNNLWRTEISYDDGLTFAAFGQSNSVTIAVPDIASLLEFGAYSGGLNPFSGVIYWAEVRSGLGGPVQARFDAEDAVSGLTAVTSKLTGEVWTLQGAATLVADSPDGGLSHIDWHDLCRTARGTLWELELVSRIVKPDGSSAEITDTRRATARTVSINKRRLSIRFADVDTAAMDRPFPFNRYTKEAFAKIYEGHIGRVITDCSPGTQIKLPMSYIDNNGSNSYVFAVCEKRSGPTYTVNTVYRDGRIVSASEYSASTATSSGGLVVVTVVFAREQRDTNGRQYEFTADISVSGSREPSGEVQRLLALAGITCDSASFTAAISADAAGSFQIDAAYATERTVRAIVEDLLQVARGWLQKTSNGSWAIVQ
ncbi:MAG: hypothetical protein JNM52_04590, partial [Betaproteobacteria bacterium]|nr:hypothetical protein [Betaproteobacteria bacterium]